MTASKPTILLVEDDENDRMFVERAFKKAGIPVEFRAVTCGEDAVSYLSARAPYADRADHPLPSLVLMDLKLTGMSGFETMEWARKRAEWKSLPIAVLTSSREGADVARAYEAGATTYFVKPADSDDLQSLVNTVAEYWLVFAKLPPACTS
jgi:CheY-like chemotaxis protein